MIKLKHILTEIGEGVKPFAFKRTGPASVDRTWMTTMSMHDKSDAPGRWTRLPDITYSFKSDKASYIVNIVGEYTRYVTINFGSKRSDRKPQDYNLVIAVSFDTVNSKIGTDKESITNYGEQFQVVSTVTEIIDQVVKDVAEWQWVKLTEIHIAPKLEDTDQGVPIAQSKRGRLYLAYIQKQGKRLPGDWTAEIQKDRFVLLNQKISSTNTDRYISL